MDARQRIGDYVRRALGTEVRDADDIFELGIADSLFAMQLVALVERDFAIAVEPEDLDIANFCSISALVDFVEAKRGVAGGRDSGLGHPAD